MNSEPGAVECTAFDRSATTERNALFTPPCTCPRCVAPNYDDEPESGTIWLRKDGPPVRHQVENMDLGRTGRDLLGGAPSPRPSPKIAQTE